MIGRRMKMWYLGQVIVLVGLGIFWAPSSEAAEQRCNALGANCVCSEPLQMTGYTNLDPPNGYFWNPNDSTTLECNGGLGSAVGYAVTMQDLLNRSTISSDATILAALPAGNTVQRFLKYNEGFTGQFFLGHDFFSSLQFSTRVAMRWYEYYSPNYGFDDDPGFNGVSPGVNSCQGNKLMELAIPGQDQIVDEGFGIPNIYPFTMFDINGSQDCCGFSQLNNTMPQNVLQHAMGPQTFGVSPYYTYQRGNWLRWELVIVNRDSHINPYEAHLFVKNVTQNAPEYEVIDTCLPNAGLLTPCQHKSSQILHAVSINGYRQGTCPGYRAYSYVMMAGWDTNAGQRIGAAVEIEGGQGGGGTPPAPPTNLRVTKLLANE